MEIVLTYGEHFDSVVVDGKPLSPSRSQEVWNHSPDGFSWGYGGSGPSQLALALLLEAGLSDEEASRLHQQFKWDFVATWPHNAPSRSDVVQVHEVDVEGWIEQNRAVA